MRVLVFGDSITQGFWDLEHGGWVQRLRQSYDKQVQVGKDHDYYAFFNLGIDGDTTEGLLNRFEDDAKSRIGNQGAVLIFSIGVNDTEYKGQEFFSTPEKFKAQLFVLLEKARKHSSKIIFLGFFPIVDSLVQPMPWSRTGKCYSTERIKRFNNVLEAFCKENKVTFVDTYSVFSTKNLKDYLPDGIHPNDAGHQLIYQTVKPELDKLLEQ